VPKTKLEADLLGRLNLHCPTYSKSRAKGGAVDEQTLDSLRAALDASPENEQLLKVLLDSYLAVDRVEKAMELVGGREVADIEDGALRLAMARVLLKAGAATKALGFAESVSVCPEVLILQARVLLALDRKQDASKAYRAAVGDNAALEDAELAMALSISVHEVVPTEGRPRLRVISNDDTDVMDLDRLMHPEPERLNFGDVGGLSAIKKQIRKKIILPFEKPSLFKKFRKRVGGGILLYGPPGCGKTLLARATAGECNAEFFNVSISDVLDMYMGESEQKLHTLFEKARSSVPAVLFFDEIEALGGKRQYSRELTTSKVVSQFLSEMDGFSGNNSGVLILGATNVPWAVDAAFRRPGRFDRVLFVPPPDREARKAILEIELRDRPRSEDINFELLAKLT